MLQLIRIVNRIRDGVIKGVYKIGRMAMILVITFKDEDVEVLRNVRSVSEEGDSLEVRSEEVNVARYDRAEIQKAEIVWR